MIISEKDGVRVELLYMIRSVEQVEFSHPLAVPISFPKGWAGMMPVFHTREDALAFMPGSEAVIVELTRTTKTTKEKS